MRFLPEWSVHSFERLQNNQHGSLSSHVTWVGAWWAARGDDDLVIFGPYWPDWMSRSVCRVAGHRSRRSTAVSVRDHSIPPTTYHCCRCSKQLGESWDTFGNVVRYGDDPYRDDPPEEDIIDPWGEWGDRT